MQIISVTEAATFINLPTSTSLLPTSTSLFSLFSYISFSIVTFSASFRQLTDSHQLSTKWIIYNENMRSIGFAHEAKYTYLSAHIGCCNIELAPQAYSASKPQTLTCKVKNEALCIHCILFPIKRSSMWICTVVLLCLSDSAFCSCLHIKR